MAVSSVLLFHPLIRVILLGMEKIYGQLQVLLRHPTQMNPSNGDIITYLNIPDNDPWGISWDGTNLLVTGRSSNKIYRLGAAIGAVTRLSNPITKTDANILRVTYDFVFQD